MGITEKRVAATMYGLGVVEGIMEKKMEAAI